ncbi:MAG: hypothetical protein HY909_23500 [Deltaproteobacteria bacterium]|nr:hypothetical protein [Deltaproteobacteria bacterium]
MTPPARIEVPDAVRPAAGLAASLRGSVLALAEALFVSDDGPPPPERVAWLLDDLDDFLGHAGPRARLSFGLCVRAVAWTCPLLVGRPGSFRALSLPLRLRALERLEKLPLGLALFGAKALLCLVWYEHPENERFAGYDGRCLRG